MIIIPVLYFSSTFLILFSQVLLPLNMAASRFYLKREHTRIQVYAVGVLIFAIVLSSFQELNQYINNKNITSIMSPLMMLGGVDEYEESNYQYYIENGTVIRGPASQHPDIVSLHTNHYIILFVMLIVVKLISTASTIYREKIYKKYNLDPIKTVAIVSTIQIPIQIPTICFLFIPLPKPAIYVPYNQFFSYVQNGTSILFYDNDNEILLVFLLYNFCIMVSSIIDFMLTQKISSTFNIINNISILMLSVLFLGWKDLAGSAYKEISLYQYLSIFLIILAILTYWEGTPKEQRTITTEEEEEGERKNSLDGGGANSGEKYMTVRDGASKSVAVVTSLMNRQFYGKRRTSGKHIHSLVYHGRETDDDDNDDDDDDSDSKIYVYSDVKEEEALKKNNMIEMKTVVSGKSKDTKYHPTIAKGKFQIDESVSEKILLDENEDKD